MLNNFPNSDNNIVFVVDDITVEVHKPSIITSEEDNKQQLAKYLYRLMEIGSRVN